MKLKWWLAVGVIAVLITLAIIAWLKRPLVPSEIRRQVNFVILVPSKNNLAKTARSSFKYNAAEKVLTYTAMLNQTKLTISNQATPEVFTDIPQTYDKVVNGMHPYASFDSPAGKVSLTRPPNTDNQQTAVVKFQGTLVFVRADHDLSADQWRRFFNSLNELK